MRKLGTSLVYIENVTAQLEAIKAAGFDCCFTSYKDKLELEEFVTGAERLGLEIETMHLPFGKVNRLWTAGNEGDEYYDYLAAKIAKCAEVGIDKAIMHVTVGNTAPEIGPVGLDRFRALCDYSANKGVKLCFENLEPLPHIHAVMEMIDENHGFCWDCGHNLCYSPHIDMMALYGDRLLCTHVHDNKGVTQPGNIDYRDDLHLLPFDGVLDWDWFGDKLRAANYTGPITLELALEAKQGYTYTVEELYDEAYKRALRLRAITDGE